MTGRSWDGGYGDCFSTNDGRGNLAEDALPLSPQPSTVAEDHQIHSGWRSGAFAQTGWAVGWFTISLKEFVSCHHAGIAGQMPIVSE